MIAKTTRGGSFRGAARYALDERHGLNREHQPEIIGGNMAGRTSTELAREFEAARQLRPDVRHQHCHVLLKRIRTDGTLVPQQYRECLRSKEACRAFEREFRLRPV